MQPGNTNIPKGPEVQPVAPVETGLDRLPPLNTTPETGLNTGAERHEQVAELRAVQADAAATAASVAQTTPVAPVVDGTTSAAAAPSTAAHDDIIEKEWVDRAKKIVTDTPDDPHKREEQVTALHNDYLRKRFGKKLGAAS